MGLVALRLFKSDFQVIITGNTLVVHLFYTEYGESFLF